MPDVIHNPFTQRGPIRDAQAFVGRETALAQVLTFLRSGQCVSIIGPRRIGKTSLAIHCARAEVLQEYGCDPQRLCGIVQSCETWEGLTPDALYQLLADALAEHLPPGLPPSADLSPYRRLDQAARSAASIGLQIVVVLDEFDLLSRNPALGERFFTSLRGLVTAYGLSFLTISTRPLAELTFAQGSTLSSPFFNVFAQIRLGLFLPGEGGQLLDHYTGRVGVNLPPDLRAEVLSLAGPHPLLLQIAGFHAFELLAEAGASIARLRPLFLADARQHWAYWWHTLEPRDQRLLALLLIDGERDPRGVRRLAEAGLVLSEEGRVSPLSSAFAAFAQEQPLPGLLSSPPITLDPDRRLALVGSDVVALTSSESAILALMLRVPGHVCSYADLDHVLDVGQPTALAVGTDRVKAQIRTLRAKLGASEQLIENVRGDGFRLVTL
jgi:hypothetical protein